MHNTLVCVLGIPTMHTRVALDWYHVRTAYMTQTRLGSGTYIMWELVLMQ